jgi:hypothetical protein
MPKVFFALLCAMSMAALPQQASAQTVEIYKEMCDASAAVALGSDHFVVANDELNALKIYQRGQPVPTSSIDLSSFLGTKPKKESDLEGAAMIGNRIYWISSHGTNSDGEVQERRHRLFATEIAGTTPPTVKAVDKPYTTLVKDLDAKFPELGLAAAAKIAPKKPNGLNIEGLAADNGALLIGFRNPLLDDQALVIPLENPEDVVAGKAPKFGNPSRLDLEKRGIRSIERIGSRFLIIAGPVGGTGTFSLYGWTGPNEKKLVKLDTDLLGLNAEAMFSIPGKDTVQILSDDGTVQVDGMDCKDQTIAKQSFRSIAIKP